MNDPNHDDPDEATVHHYAICAIWAGAVLIALSATGVIDFSIWTMFRSVL